MTYEEWLATVPETITTDPLWKMKVYRLALLLNDLAWRDTLKLASEHHLSGVADQLLRAVGSIGANIAEGYSRNSGKDRARFDEYALGSARESRHWYYSVRYHLTDTVVQHRLDTLAQICRLLMTMTPEERKHTIAEPRAEYETDIDPATTLPLA
jgi:four helix bundle protein